MNTTPKAGAQNASRQRKLSPRSIGVTTQPSPQQRYDHRRANLLMKVAECDWHGVADEAMDIRELIAAYPDLRKHEEAMWSRSR